VCVCVCVCVCVSCTVQNKTVKKIIAIPLLPFWTFVAYSRVNFTLLYFIRPILGQIRLPATYAPVSLKPIFD